MRKILSVFIFALLLCACGPQKQGFVLRGSSLDLPDGTVVSLSNSEGDHEQLGEAIVHGGCFELHADIQAPLQCMLTTNNLALVDSMGWPMDSIRWNYIDCFVSPTPMRLTPSLTVEGGQVQADFAEWEARYKEEPRGAWRFILDHPQSSVAGWLMNAMLLRGYNLTDAELDSLEIMVQAIPDDTARFTLSRQRLARYRHTVKGGPLLDMELTEAHPGRPTPGPTPREGRRDGVCSLRDVVPEGKYVLIDFWASWCGICLYSMPDVAKLAADFSDSLTVIGVSIDTDAEAWHEAMAKHPEPWQQYRTTERGYETFATDYQVSNGVPYYLLLSPDGRVIGSPERADDVRSILGGGAQPGPKSEK